MSTYFLFSQGALNGPSRGSRVLCQNACIPAKTRSPPPKRVLLRQNASLSAKSLSSPPKHALPRVSCALVLPSTLSVLSLRSTTCVSTEPTTTRALLHPRYKERLQSSYSLRSLPFLLALALVLAVPPEAGIHKVRWRWYWARCTSPLRLCLRSQPSPGPSTSFTRGTHGVSAYMHRAELGNMYVPLLLPPSFTPDSQPLARLERATVRPFSSSSEPSRTASHTLRVIARARYENASVALKAGIPLLLQSRRPRLSGCLAPPSTDACSNPREGRCSRTSAFPLRRWKRYRRHCTLRTRPVVGRARTW